MKSAAKIVAQLIETDEPEEPAFDVKELAASLDWQKALEALGWTAISENRYFNIWNNKTGNRAIGVRALYDAKIDKRSIKFVLLGPDPTWLTVHCPMYLVRHFAEKLDVIFNSYCEDKISNEQAKAAFLDLAKQL